MYAQDSSVNQAEAECEWKNNSTDNSDNNTNNYRYDKSSKNINKSR